MKLTTRRLFWFVLFLAGVGGGVLVYLWRKKARDVTATVTVPQDEITISRVRPDANGSVVYVD